MQKSQLTETEIVFALRQAEPGNAGAFHYCQKMTPNLNVNRSRSFGLCLHGTIWRQAKAALSCLKILLQ